MSTMEAQNNSEREHERTISIQPNEAQNPSKRKSVLVFSCFVLIGAACFTGFSLLLFLTSRDAPASHSREKRQVSMAASFPWRLHGWRGYGCKRVVALGFNEHFDLAKWH